MIIDILKYILMGLVQGVTEVLPISSSGHLAIMGNILKIEDNTITFRVFLHLASLIATLFFLRKRLWQLIKGFFLYLFKKDKNYKKEFHTCWMIVVATLPAVVFTILVGDFIESISNSLWVIGMLLMINGIALFIFTKVKPREKQEITYLDALVMGGFQCFGLFSGISRSGSCINGASVRGLKKENVADFVFIMLIPAVLGATVLELKDISSFALSGDTIVLYLISFVVTLFVTYFSFELLLVTIRKSKFIYFTIYCEIIGLITLIFGLVK